MGAQASRTGVESLTVVDTDIFVDHFREELTMSDANAVNAIRSMKPDVDSICETVRIVLRNVDSPSRKEKSEPGYTLTSLPEKGSWNTPLLIPLPVRLTSLPKKVFRVIQNWVTNEETDKVCELANSLKEILDNEGIIIRESACPAPATTSHRSLCQLTLMMGALSTYLTRSRIYETQ